jgi:hypothetical protein
VRLTTSPPSCVECHEIWEPKPPGTLWATPGSVTGLLVPHNLISTQESPVPLLKFQMAPRLKILMSSGSKKGTQIYFFFLSKIPANETPPGTPTGPLWKETPVYRTSAYLSNTS